MTVKEARKINKLMNGLVKENPGAQASSLLLEKVFDVLGVTLNT